ncbi:MAG: hypothetical protein E6K13_09080 [Methanobacteriota archaeon]|nr:MAG: hypothetical protein E6K13_09080 [Euryarchaeota archaeon]
MRFRFVLDGSAYSKHKNAFKETLKRHGLMFRGTRETFVWASRQESVTATFERDEAQDVTIQARLVWQSRKKTPLLNEIKEWVWSVGGHGGEEDDATPDPSASDAIDRELAIWDAIHKPDVDRLRRDGRPGAWIEKDVRDWQRKRREKRRELAGRFRPT